MTPPDLLIVVEGEQLLYRPQDGTASPLAVGTNGIAISADGERVYYCPFASRRLWSVAVDALMDRDDDDATVGSVWMRATGRTRCRSRLTATST